MPVSALRGAIQQLELAARSGDAQADTLDRLAADDRRTAAPTLREIATATARHFGLKLADLKSPSRRQGVVAARGATIYLARLLTRHSLEQIGRYLGGRDHTTVLHAQQRTEQLAKRDPVLRQSLAELRKSLSEGH